MERAAQVDPGAQDASARDGGSDEQDGGKRRQILDGARKVFLARGFDGASMGEIARAAGVSKGTLYVYFESKDALFEALTRSERSSLAEVLFQLDEHDADVRGALTRVGRSLLEMMARPDHVSSVRMVIGAADRFPGFAQSYYEAGPRFGAERLRVYLERQVAAGRLAIEDPAVAAEQFLNLCSAGLLKRLLFAVVSELDPAESEANVQSAVRVFMAAYGPTHNVQPYSSRSAAEIRAWSSSGFFRIIAPRVRSISDS